MLKAYSLPHQGWMSRCDAVNWPFAGPSRPADARKGPEFAQIWMEDGDFVHPIPNSHFVTVMKWLSLVAVNFARPYVGVREFCLERSQPAPLHRRELQICRSITASMSRQLGLQSRDSNEDPPLLDRFRLPKLKLPHCRPAEKLEILQIYRNLRNPVHPCA